MATRFVNGLALGDHGGNGTPPGGTTVSGTEPMDARVQRYSMSHGLNFFVVNVVYSQVMSPRMQRAQQLRAEVSEIAHESFDAALVVKTLGREDTETRRFEERAFELRRAASLWWGGEESMFSVLFDMGTVHNRLGCWGRRTVRSRDVRPSAQSQHVVTIARSASCSARVTVRFQSYLMRAHEVA